MRIIKKYQGTVPENKIMNTYSDSESDTYSCNKVNELLANSSPGGGGGTGTGLTVDMIYPVGSIYISASDAVNPNVIFNGTTWERFANGRTLVGVDETQDEFATIGKVGGHKELAKHSHTGTTNTDGAHYHTTASFKANGDNSAVLLESWGSYGSTREARIPYSGTNGTHNHAFTTNETGNGDSGNLQPYITVFIWKRIG